LPENTNRHRELKAARLGLKKERCSSAQKWSVKVQFWLVSSAVQWRRPRFVSLGGGREQDIRTITLILL